MNDEDAGDFPCPNCGALIYGDTPRCPSCGDYVTPGAPSARGHPWWIWLGLGLLAAALLAAVFRC